jgi:hypothetical protein
MVHGKKCFCDKCIVQRSKDKMADRLEKERLRKFESDSQDYIRRRGGVDPRV